MDAGDPRTPPCLEATRMRDDRLLVTCHVTPHARNERIACEGGKLRVWLRAPPLEGAANKALIELFARMLQSAQARGHSGARRDSAAENTCHRGIERTGVLAAPRLHGKRINGAVIPATTLIAA